MASRFFRSCLLDSRTNILLIFSYFLRIVEDDECQTIVTLSQAITQSLVSAYKDLWIVMLMKMKRNSILTGDDFSWSQSATKRSLASHNQCRKNMKIFEDALYPLVCTNRNKCIYESIYTVWMERKFFKPIALIHRLRQHATPSTTAWWVKVLCEACFPSSTAAWTRGRGSRGYRSTPTAAAPSAWPQPLALLMIAFYQSNNISVRI